MRVISCKYLKHADLKQDRFIMKEELEMAQRICPKCNHIENEYTYFCTECGGKTIEYSGSISTSPTKGNNKTIENMTIQQSIQLTGVEIYQQAYRHQELECQDIQLGITDDILQEQIVTDEEIKASHIEYDKENSGVKSPVRLESGQSLNNKGIIIGLAVTVGLLLITVIALATSKGKDNHMEVAASTSYDNNALQNENVAGNKEEEEYQQSAESITDDSDELFSSTNSENEESVIEAVETEEILDDGIHSYELVVADVTWSEAFNDCISRGGYLARITTDDEYQAILQQVYSEGKDNIKFWIAGARDDSEDYHWIYEDGSYSKEVINHEDKYSGYWLENEPSFYDEATQSSEDRMNMFYIKSKGIWVWNDVPDDILGVANFYSGTIGYICEYE